MVSTRRASAFLASSIVVAAACGGSGDATVDDATAEAGASDPRADGGDVVEDIDAGTVDASSTRCTLDEQCEGRCANGECAAPSTTDGKQSPSLGETDIDCGGPTAPPCGEGLGCSADGDCTTKVCGAAKRCALAPSCRGTNGAPGIETCGSGEAGTAGADVESCCTSLPLPATQGRRLDRYEITAGRVREFLRALAEANGGEPDVRAFAKTHAAANPTSELGKVASDFPGLLDVLPTEKAPSAALPLPVHLGAFPLDPMNPLDGCFVGPGAYGHATYWQEPNDLAPFGVGYPSNAPDGVRKFSREELDAKPMNCVMPLFLAAFCAWDGGELARTSDYREVWGRTPVDVAPPVGPAQTVYIPWAQLLAVGSFNWRNGHGEACPVPGWPSCITSQPYHYQFPTGASAPADDDSAAIAAPGRFPLDVTKAVSANNEGWLDVGGNLMEAAWPNGAVNVGLAPIKDVCDVSAAGSAGTPCKRGGQDGIRRYEGDLPHVALVGYSFEGHTRRSEAYLASTDGDELKISSGDLKPVTFQYGKVGGRCARLK